MTTTQEYEYNQSYDYQWKNAQEKYNDWKTPAPVEDEAPAGAATILSKIENELIPNLRSTRESTEAELMHEFDRVAGENAELSEMINTRTERIRELFKEFNMMKEKYVTHCKKELANRPVEVTRWDTAAETEQYGSTNKWSDWKDTSKQTESWKATPHSASWSRSSQRSEEWKKPEATKPAVAEPEADDFKPKWASSSESYSNDWNKPSYGESKTSSWSSNSKWDSKPSEKQANDWTSSNRSSYGDANQGSQKWSSKEPSFEQNTSNWTTSHKSSYGDASQANHKWASTETSTAPRENDWSGSRQSAYASDEPEKWAHTGRNETAKEWKSEDRQQTWPASDQWGGEAHQGWNEKKQTTNAGWSKAAHAEYPSAYQRAPEVAHRAEAPAGYGWTAQASAIPKHIAVRFEQRRRDIPPPPSSGVEYVASNSWGGAGALG